MEAKPKAWGVTAAEFYVGLRDKLVQVITLDGKLYRGLLVGVDVYDLFLKPSSGGVILLAKHAVKVVQSDAPAEKGSSGS